MRNANYPWNTAKSCRGADGRIPTGTFIYRHKNAGHEKIFGVYQKGYDLKANEVAYQR